MADAPEKIWAGSCSALGAPDTGFWYPVRTPATPTPYIRADLVDDLRKALETFIYIGEGDAAAAGAHPIREAALSHGKAALTRIKGDGK